MSRRSALGETLWVLALGVTAVLAADGAWRQASALGWLAVAWVLGVLWTPLLRRLRISPWLAVLLGALTLLLVVRTLLVVGGSLADRPSWRMVLDAVPFLLTSPRPAPVTAELIAPGILVVGALALGVGVRLTRPGRHRLSPVLAAVGLYAGGLALTGGQGDRFGLVGAALLLLVVTGWVAWGAADGIPVPSWRRSGAVLAGVLVPLVLAGALLDRSDAADPRTAVQPPRRTVVVDNPVPYLDAWQRDPARVLCTVSGDLFPLHLAVLTDYDGATWRAPSLFRPLGVVAEPALAPGDRQARVTVTVRLGDLPGPWLPAVGTPTELDVPGALVDPDSGSAVAPDRPDRYTVSGLLDAPLDDSVRSASLPAPASVPGLVSVPRLPASLDTYALTAVAGARTPYETAKAIEAAVRGSRTLDPAAPGGVSYHRVEQLLLGDPGTPGAGRGGSAQYATAFVVLARRVGLATRLVVGFTPGTPGAVAGERVVRGRDAFAWPEVYFSGQGWVPFSPTPAGVQMGPDGTDAAPIPSAAVPSPTAAGPTVTAEVDRAAPAGDPARWLPWLLGGVALLLVLALLVLAVLRRRRTARHRGAGPTGAWSELLDAARLHGSPPAAGTEPEAVAADLDGSGAAGAATLVVTAAERSAYGPEGSNENVWEHARTAVRGLRRSSPVVRRLLWPVHPGVLRDRTIRNVPVDLTSTEAAPVEDHDDGRWAPTSRTGARTQ